MVAIMWRLFGGFFITYKFPIFSLIHNSSNRLGGVRGEARFPPGGKGGSALPPIQYDKKLMVK
jgi:hypothetical protein